MTKWHVDRRKYGSGNKRFQIGPKDDAFLLVGVCTGEHGDARFGRARVEREMRNAGRDVNHVSRFAGDVLLELVAEPHFAMATDDVNRGFMPLVQVRLCPATRKNTEHVHAEPG